MSSIAIVRTFNVDLRTSPPRLVDKGWIDSAAARYRLLTHQSRRYQGAARGVMRAAVGWLAPDLSVRYRVRFKLGPAYYHHLPPRDKAEHLERARRSGLRMPDPVERAESVRAEWAALERFVERSEDRSLCRQHASIHVVD